MKHPYFKTILLCLCLFASINTFAEAIVINGLYYNLDFNQKTAEVTNNPNNYTGTIKIPETVTFKNSNYSVTSIGDKAFYYDDLTSVTIGNSVKSIGEYAFYQCSGLTSVNIGNSVTSIGDHAFEDCSGLTSVTIPNSLTSIGERTFYNCSRLTSVTIPNSVTSIGSSAFYNCFGLEKVIVPDIAAWCGIDFADYSANPLHYACCLYYNETTKITNLIIPNSVTSIGSSAFYNCCLTSVTIPNSVTSIGDDAFARCSRLTSVTIGNSVKNIGSRAFQFCDELKKVIVPDIAAWCGITFEENYYQSNPLYYAKHLYSDETTEITNLIIPNSVTSIGESAFFHCEGLTSVTIPNSVTSIGMAAFSGCSGLEKVIVPDIAAWCNITFQASEYYGTNPLFYAKHLYSDETTEITNLIIPNSVTSIGSSAFEGCSGLTSVTIPNSVTSIGDYAFYGCPGLTSVSIGNSVTSIGYDAFRNCSGLTSVTIPNSVTSIGSSAFEGCSGLTSVTIGNSVTSIGSSAFAYCGGLTDVYCYAEKVPSTQSYAFSGSYIEFITLHVPAASVEQYKTTAPWSNFGAIVATDGTMPDPPTPPTPEKCATPAISYSKGELTFSCETEGAEYVYEITDTDIKKGFAAKVSLTVTYNISVYATKTNYENSDTIQATLCWIEQQPQTEGITDEDAIAEVQAVPVLIQTQGNTITVQGAEAGTEIILYSTNGVQLDSVIATTGTASLNASGLSGSVAIVKIGNKTVKVLVKQ